MVSVQEHLQMKKFFCPVVNGISAGTSSDQKVFLLNHVTNVIIHLAHISIQSWCEKHSSVMVQSHLSIFK